MAKRSRRMKDVLEEASPLLLEQNRRVIRSRRMIDTINANSTENHVAMLQPNFGSHEAFVPPTTALVHFDIAGQGSQNHASRNIETELHYSEDSDDDDHRDVNEMVNMTKKNGRGPSKPWDDWGKGKKIMLEWDEIGHPIGENANRLGSKIRSYARNGNWFPLNITRWDANANKTILEQIWKEVQANTNAPDRFKQLCFARIAKSWKSFKNRIKNDHYNKYQTDTERLANKPSEVLADQWPELVKYWGLEITQNVSSQNKINRSNLFAYSKTGRTAHASIRAQRVKENLPVDNLSMWLVTRSKDGIYDKSDGAADREVAIKRRLEELPEEDREDPMEREKIFREIVGEDGHGHALLGGVGVRPAPKRMQYPQPPSLPTHDCAAEVARLASKLEEQARHHQEEISHLREQITTYAVEIVDLRKDLVEQEQHFKENLSHLGRDIEWSILTRLQNGSRYVPGFDLSNKHRQPSCNGSISRLLVDEENSS